MADLQASFTHGLTAGSLPVGDDQRVCLISRDVSTTMRTSNEVSPDDANCLEGSSAVKVTIDIDCTPQEARTFLGLPNVEPLQDHLMQQLQDQLSRYLAGADAEAMLKTWLPESIKGIGQLQEHFWRQFLSSSMAAAAAAGTEPKDSGTKAP